MVEATKAYASPEQLFGGGPERPILGGTDLFSWALTVCQMFAPGRHPYCVTGFDEAALYAIDQSVALGVAPPRPDLDAPAERWPARRGGPGPRLGIRLSAATARPTCSPSSVRPGTNTEVLVGATKVLGPPVARLARGPAAADPGSAATPPRPGCWGMSTSAGSPRVAYAGGAVLVAFAAALPHTDPARDGRSP